MIYAKENLNINFTPVDVVSFAQEMVFKPAGIKFKMGKITYIMIGIYRPPGRQGSVETFLNNLRDILEPF